VWGHAARLWQNGQVFLAELLRITVSVATQEVELGSSAVDLENPSQTACNDHNISTSITEDKFIINITTMTEVLLKFSLG